MAEDNATLATFYQSWDAYLALLRAALAPLTAEQLTLRAAPHLHPLGEIAAHIIAARVGWFTGDLGEDWGAATPLAHWDEPGAPALTAADLVGGLDRSRDLLRAALDRWDTAAMAQTFVDAEHGQHHEFSRGWVIWHLLEHDLHHGGEISLILGMHGLQAPDI